jgi:PIN domain nuclease of toxin-antitoxin system
MLDISADHAMFVEKLPDHHADPFNRMLVAQALYEPMHLLTHDKIIAAYSDTIILV